MEILKVIKASGGAKLDDATDKDIVKILEIIG